MITLSALAGQMLKQIFTEEKLPANTALRLGVTKDGCSNSGTQLKYALDFDQNPSKPGDNVFESEGVKIYVDKDSLPHLDGLQLDVRQEFGGYQFMFKNPNAKHSCGCGHTFSEEGPTQH